MGSSAIFAMQYILIVCDRKCKSAQILGSARLMGEEQHARDAQETSKGSRQIVHGHYLSNISDSSTDFYWAKTYKEGKKHAFPTIGKGNQSRSICADKVAQ